MAINPTGLTSLASFSQGMDFGWAKPPSAEAATQLKAGVQFLSKGADTPGAPAIAGNSSVGSVASSFGAALKEQLNDLNEVQQTAEIAVQDYTVGKEIPLHQVMMRVNQAELTLNLATQVRNKIVSAYQEISRMPI